MKNKLTLALFQLFLYYFACAQNSNVVPAENFPRATPSVKGVSSLDINPDLVVVYTKDEVYVNRHGLDLHLQILSPKVKQALPCIVYIQGSA